MMRSQHLAVHCRICEFPAADSGVRVDTLDPEKLAEWWRCKLGAELEDLTDADEARSVICQFCIWEARMDHEISLTSNCSIIENINWWTGHDSDKFFLEYFYKKELIQPCRVELEKIAFDGVYRSENNAASAFGSQVHESEQCSINFKGNAEVETHVCLKDIEKQSNKKCKSAKMKLNQCNLCQVIFKSYHTLHNHIKKNHHNSVRCRSHMCGTYFFTEAERQQHEEEVHGNKVHRCIYCGALFSKGSDKLYGHIKKKHKEAIKCDYKYHCPNYFHTKTQLDEHILKVHIGTFSHADQVQCIYCGRIVSDIRRLHIHMFDMHAAIKIKCRFMGCATYFLSQIDSDEHFRLQHLPGESLKKRQCPKCTYKTNCRDSWMRHIKRKHTSATLTCSECPKKFSLEINLNRHLKTFHGERCTCHFCGKIMQKKSMRNHFLLSLCKVSINK